MIIDVSYPQQQTEHKAGSHGTKHLQFISAIHIPPHLKIQKPSDEFFRISYTNK
jgi:hypothetical protein